MDLLATIAVAAAGGFGFLSVQHPKQFLEMVVAIFCVGGVVFILSIGIYFGIEYTSMELRYELSSEERDEIMQPIDKWRRRWGWTVAFLVISGFYLVFLAILSESIIKDRNEKATSKQSINGEGGNS